MLNKQGFDLWANDYDKTVQLSEENDTYPFAGYKNVLNFIFNVVMEKEKSKILDIGFGTGVLTTKLYENGHQIDGIDFSAKMIESAQVKMPHANLIEWDLNQGLPGQIKEITYDSIISTYALHHLTDEAKISFIQELLEQLSAGGKILIGDIAFQTRNQLMECREQNIQYWDEDEFYFVYDELKGALQHLCTCEFFSLSHCGGVIIISK